MKLLVIAFIAALIIGFILHLPILNNQTKIGTNKTTQANDVTDPQRILTLLEANLNINKKIEKTTTALDWANSDGDIVPVSGYTFNIASQSTNIPNDGNTTTITISPYVANAGIYLNSIGFQKANPPIEKYKSPTGYVFRESYQYTKGALYCMVQYDVSTYPDAWFFCGHYDKKADELIKELRNVVNPDNNPNESIAIRKVVGNFVTGSALYGGGGHVWFAIKENGAWKQIWEGQNSIDCAVVRQYTIPLELYNVCNDYTNLNQ